MGSIFAKGFMKQAQTVAAEESSTPEVINEKAADAEIMIGLVE